MGDIFIAWDDNHVLDLISNQKSTTLHEKASYTWIDGNTYTISNNTGITYCMVVIDY